MRSSVSRRLSTSIEVVRNSRSGTWYSVGTNNTHSLWVNYQQQKDMSWWQIEILLTYPATGLNHSSQLVFSLALVDKLPGKFSGCRVMLQVSFVSYSTKGQCSRFYGNRHYQSLMLPARGTTGHQHSRDTSIMESRENRPSSFFLLPKMQNKDGTLPGQFAHDPFRANEDSYTTVYKVTYHQLALLPRIECPCRLWLACIPQ